MGERGKIPTDSQLKTDGGNNTTSITGINTEMGREEGTSKGSGFIKDFTE